MLDIVASSDFHGNLPEITKPFDLMLLAGDLEPATNHNFYYQRDWYKMKFIPWVQNLPFKNVWSKVIFIAGNHSRFLAQEQHSEIIKEFERKCNGRLQYLHNEYHESEHLDEDTGDIVTLKIFGTPYCKIFGDWWNMLTPDGLYKVYSEIPENVDILLSHDAPLGTCDICYGLKEFGITPEHIGNRQLADAIIEKSPRICLVGHLHSANHNWEQLGQTQVRQVSYLNERYQPTYEPFYFKWKDGVVQDGD